ncbi:MAG: YjjG family noncanonical pyrimidine nucleotidase, partial [Bacteroidales bacterium]
TLWDFEKNCREILMEMYHKFQLFEAFQGFDEFFTHYLEYNSALWHLYRENAIDKDELTWKRFLLTLKEGGLDDEHLAQTLSDEYLILSPTKTKLFPHVKFGLIYLKKQYTLHLITNGFKEVQYEKLKNSGLKKFFTYVFISEELGVQKPEAAYFEKAMKLSNATTNNAVVIGDDFLVDIMGAANAGIDQIWFNPQKTEPPVSEKNVPTKVFSKWKDIIHLM